MGKWPSYTTGTCAKFSDIKLSRILCNGSRKIAAPPTVSSPPPRIHNGCPSHGSTPCEKRDDEEISTRVEKIEKHLGINKKIAA
jgi:hypothetical protein